MKTEDGKNHLAFPSSVSGLPSFGIVYVHLGKRIIPMKKLIVTLVFGFVAAIGLKAQTIPDIFVPIDLSADIVVVGTMYSAGWNFTVDDGSGNPKTSIVPIKGVSSMVAYAGGLAVVSNKICKQGYKLVSSNSVGDASVYIFQKE